MRRSNRLSIAAVLLSAMLGGCADLYWDRRDTVAFYSGDAPASNIAIHTIDPWPPAAAERRLPANGELMQKAAERYRTNKTTPLRPMGTSSVRVDLAPAASAGTPGSP
ncbi:MAG TPA: hypothetical protein VG100_13480 [Xanthobacteraceae bacterium]|jgi:hypothetical protein|nr:hypothetical protein [Xanthobacteraceae bacterium]